MYRAVKAAFWRVAPAIGANQCPVVGLFTLWITAWLRDVARALAYPRGYFYAFGALWLVQAAGLAWLWSGRRLFK